MSLPSYIHSFPYTAWLPQLITSFSILQIPSNPFFYLSYIYFPILDQLNCLPLGICTLADHTTGEYSQASHIGYTKKLMVIIISCTFNMTYWSTHAYSFWLFWMQTSWFLLSLDFLPAIFATKYHLLKLSLGVNSSQAYVSLFPVIYPTLHHVFSVIFALISNQQDLVACFLFVCLIRF